MVGILLAEEPGKGPDYGKASPIGLLVVLLLLLGVFALMISMNRQLRKVPASFDETVPEASRTPETPEVGLTPETPQTAETPQAPEATDAVDPDSDAPPPDRTHDTGG